MALRRPSYFLDDCLFRLMPRAVHSLRLAPTDDVGRVLRMLHNHLSIGFIRLHDAMRLADLFEAEDAPRLGFQAAPST
jgi:hypothetical protein